jgi:predicted CoA-substrate-specific enzyme activase
MEAKGQNLSDSQRDSDSVLVAGIDLGSLYTKAIVADMEGQIISSSLAKSSIPYEEVARNVLDEALKSGGLVFADIGYVIASGYGRSRVPFANKQVTEISCHAKGANLLYPEVRTVIDIGGQDSKVIRIGDRGEVLQFVMNDKCAAGTGRFLEVMAGALDITLEELGKALYSPESETEISSMCTVFAESEVISLIVARHSKTDIISALFRAIAGRIVGMASQVGVTKEVIITGGGGKNAGLVCALEEKLRTKIIMPEEPQMVGALGAAIIAAEYARQ